MASFVAKICGLMNMAENSLTDQFQIFYLKLFTNSASCHGFASVKQKYGCRASNFSDCPLYCSFVAIKYGGSNMADTTAATTSRARNFGPQKNQGLIVVFLDNPARGELIYKIKLKKLTWFLR